MFIISSVVMVLIEGVLLCFSIVCVCVFNYVLLVVVMCCSFCWVFVGRFVLLV